MQTAVKKATVDSGVIKFLVGHLPVHLKRMVFLASLTGVAADKKEPDDEFINKLNQILNLSDTGDSALRLPIYVSEIIWKYKECIQADLDTLKDPLTDHENKQACISRIEKHTSSWLKYADSDTIMRDMCKLFNSGNGLFSTNIARP